MSFTVTAETGISISGPIEQLEISSRVGNIPRRIQLPDHSLFETEDNEGLDKLLQDVGVTQSSRILHRLESSWSWISIAFVTTLCIVLSTVYWGLPMASKEIAFSLPPSVTHLISKETLEILDKGLLEPSELPQHEQERIREHFNTKLLTVQDGGFAYHLHFRRMDNTPNAFALPSGDIIITDRLIELAGSQEEIDAILLHEIGHVVHRHALQSVLHSSFLTMVIIMVTGDATAIHNLTLALPVFLLQSHYSREHESEADQFAFHSMQQAGIDPINFAIIMERITEAQGFPETRQASADDDSAADGRQRLDDAVTIQYISTHPATSERIRKAQEYSSRFRSMQSNETNEQ